MNIGMAIRKAARHCAMQHPMTITIDTVAITTVLSIPYFFLLADENPKEKMWISLAATPLYILVCSLAWIFHSFGILWLGIMASQIIAIGVATIITA